MTNVSKRQKLILLTVILALLYMISFSCLVSEYFGEIWKIS